MIPLHYMLILLMIGIGIGIILYNQLTKKPNCFFVVIIYYWILSQYHQHRKDVLFLKSLYHNIHCIFLLEYSLISIPFYTLILLSKNYTLIPISLVFLLIVTLCPRTPQRSSAKICYDLIFPNSFEWISGCRKSIGHLSFFYCISIILIFYTPFACLAYLFILFKCVEFYREGESITLLCLVQKKAAPYIGSKVKIAILNFHLISLPYYVLSLVLYPLLWWVLVLFSMTSILSFLFCICLKYSTYIPNKRNLGSEVILGVGIFSSIVPFMYPLTIVLIIRHLILAIKNLKMHLNA